MPIPSFVSAKGTTFAFKGETYLCTDIALDKSAPERERMDMTTLDVSDGSEAVMVLGPIKPKRDPAKFSITYKSVTGTDPIVEGDEGTLTTTGATGTYRCVGSNVSRKTKSFVEGQASFIEIITEEDITA